MVCEFFFFFCCTQNVRWFYFLKRKQASHLLKTEGQRDSYLNKFIYSFVIIYLLIPHKRTPIWLHLYSARMLAI